MYKRQVRVRQPCSRAFLCTGFLSFAQGIQVKWCGYHNAATVNGVAPPARVLQNRVGTPFQSDSCSLVSGAALEPHSRILDAVAREACVVVELDSGVFPKIGHNILSRVRVFKWILGYGVENVIIS